MMETKIIFNEGGYTVEQIDEILFENKIFKRVERQWRISDGVHAFTIDNYTPELKLVSLKKEMQQYLQERRDGLDNEIKEIEK